jgi:SAM-dependent methyltransferase
MVPIGPAHEHELHEHELRRRHRMIDATGFRAVYRSANIYDHLMLPHYFGGAEDADLVAGLMSQKYGRPGGVPDLSIVELGCGTGRVTSRLAPYARSLLAVDSSQSMIATFQARYPAAETWCLDIREAVARLLGEGRAGTFDVVGTFWSLSYPISECFEEVTAEGVRPVPDQAAARERARRLVSDVVRLVAPRGHLLALYFDPDTREQRLVTRLWERIAKFPYDRRALTRELLIDELRAAEDRGEGWLAYTRLGGVAVAGGREAARAWFDHLHLKDVPALVNDPEVQQAIEGFLDECTQPSGQVAIPSGVYVIDFHAAPGAEAQLPTEP